jgi:Peptidase family S41
MRYNFFLLVVILLGWCKCLEAQQCDCYKNFSFTVAGIEANYIGYKDKIKKYYPAGITAVTNRMLNRSKTVKDEFSCLLLIHSWLQLFKDGHVRITVNTDTATEADIRHLFFNAEKSTVTETDFYNYIKGKKQVSDSLSGIWEDQRKNYRIGIMPDPLRPNSYTSLVLATKNPLWQKNLVKLRISKHSTQYRLDYIYANNHAKSGASFYFNSQAMYLGEYGTWRKNTSVDEKTADFGRQDYSAPSFTVIDNGNCLLTIPSCHSVYVKKVDSIIAANYTVLASTPHLLIDLRGNTGGSVLIFEKLLPLLYTGPIISKGSSVLASENTIQYYSITDYPGLPDSMKTVFAKEARLLSEHKGQIFNLWPDDTLVFSTTLRYPEKVSILINGSCASSTELFLLNAVQSKKVTLFGQPTLGGVDYTDGVPLNLPCKWLQVNYSSSRTNRWPAVQIDNIGIKPDITIPYTVNNWLRFVIDFNTEKRKALF